MSVFSPDGGEPSLLRKITAFTADLLSARSLDDLLWGVAVGVSRHFGFPDCVICLREGDLLVQRAATGVKDSGGRRIKNAISIPIGQGITGTAAAAGRPLLVPDVSKDPRYVFDVFAGQSELAVPIIFDGEVLGVIDSEADDADYYSASDVELLEIIANIVAPHIAAARSEKARREALEQAQEANRAKSDFLTKMSHEIRTPMNGVISMTQLLCETPLSPQQREYAEIIRRSGEGVLAVINDILDLSRIEAGKLLIDTTTFDLLEDSIFRIELPLESPESPPDDDHGTDDLRGPVLERWAGALEATPVAEVAHPEPDSGGAVDRQVIKGLRELGEQCRVDVLTETAEAFLHHAPEQLCELREAIENGDEPTAQRVAHSLKGSAQALGATRLTEACAAIEASVRSQVLNAAGSHMEVVEAELTRAAAEIRYLISRDPASGPEQSVS